MCSDLPLHFTYIQPEFKQTILISKFKQPFKHWNANSKNSNNHSLQRKNDLQTLAAFIFPTNTLLFKPNVPKSFAKNQAKNCKLTATSNPKRQQNCILRIKSS